MAAIAPAVGSHSGEFGVGRVLSRTFGVTGQNILVFFSLALIARIPLLALQLSSLGHAALTPAQAAAAAFNPSTIATGLLSLVLALVMAFVLQAAVVHGTIVSLNGRKASFVDCLATGIRQFFPVLGISVLVGLGVMLGFVLLVVPGLMLIVRWMVAVPVQVAEGSGVLQAIGRSAELTKGHRWAIFGTLVVLFLLALGLAMLSAPFAMAARFGIASVQSAYFLNLGVSTLVNTITSMISAVLAASIYFELRTIKEGIGPEQLAAVFS